MDPDEKCLCKHERKWHDSCSKCPCPFFITRIAGSADLAIWRAHLVAVKAKAERRAATNG